MTEGISIVTLVRKSFYQDSVALLALARELRAGLGVSEASALMATDANKALMAQAGLLTPEAGPAGGQISDQCALCPTDSSARIGQDAVSGRAIRSPARQ